jgi:hypothetical protein
MALSRPAALRIVRRLAAVSENVFFTDHAQRRMRQRHVTRPQVLDCLRKGLIVEGPALGTRQAWEMKFERSWSGEMVRVVVALDWDAEAAAHVLVVTVIGE